MTTRKPQMCKHRRKILNLLEYILEVDTTPESVYNVFALYVAQRDEDLCWQSDEIWADWFEKYAEKLSKNEEQASKDYMTAKEWDTSMVDGTKGDT